MGPGDGYSSCSIYAWCDSEVSKAYPGGKGVIVKVVKLTLVEKV